MSWCYLKSVRLKKKKSKHCDQGSCHPQFSPSRNRGNTLQTALLLERLNKPIQFRKVF